VLIGAVSAWSQQAGAPVRRLVTIKSFKYDRFDYPRFEVRPNPAPMTTSAQKWYQMLTEYDVEVEWLDTVEVTHYALVKNNREPKAAPFVLLKSTATYLNLKKGRHKVASYVHPSVFERWGDVDARAVIFTVGGQIVAGDTDPKAKEKWWEKLTPTEGLLMPGDKSPFALLGYDEFDATKPAAP
jgi:hypothetical protein